VTDTAILHSWRRQAATIKRKRVLARLRRWCCDEGEG